MILHVMLKWGFWNVSRGKGSINLFLSKTAAIWTLICPTDVIFLKPWQKGHNFQLKMIYCHNPTNNPKQFKTTFVGVVLLSVKKKHHHTNTTTTPGLITILAFPDNLRSWFSVCNLILTLLDEICMTTSAF
jgi:hypothetical protein